MNVHTNDPAPHRSWMVSHRRQTADRIDVKGVAAALGFLVAVAVLAGGRVDNTIEPQRSREPPAQVEAGSLVTEAFVDDQNASADESSVQKAPSPRLQAEENRPPTGRKEPF